MERMEKSGNMHDGEWTDQGSIIVFICAHIELGIKVFTWILTANPIAMQGKNGRMYLVLVSCYSSHGAAVCGAIVFGMPMLREYTNGE